MIVYDRFWATLKQSSQSTYTLIKDHHISSSTIDNLHKNKPLNTTTINDLCIIFECRVEDIIEYVQSNADQRLQSLNRQAHSLPNPKWQSRYRRLQTPCYC